MTTSAPPSVDTRETTPVPRWAAIGLIIGTVLYIVPSALHGNPPIESAEQTLRYVAERPSWRIVHLVNIAALLIWAGCLSTLTPALQGQARTISRAARTVMIATAAVFAVYFSLHAQGLTTAADRFTAATDKAAVLSETESLLMILGSVAFTAQAMIGASILLYGITIVAARGLPSWLGWIGAAVGAGWLTGAVAIDFAIIVPFTTVGWLWMVAVAVTLWLSRSRWDESGATEAPTASGSHAHAG